MIYLELFWNFLQIGLFTIGGGYAALPLIKNRIVDINGYLTIGEFMDILAIAESTPGPLAINAATFVGVKTSGILGGVVSTLGLIAPSLIIVLILGYIYSKYRGMGALKKILRVIRPVAIALIAAAAVTIVKLAFFGAAAVSVGNLNYVTMGLFVVCLFVLRKFKLNPIWVMLGSGVAGIVIHFLI
ncbi:MAG: chromate transporter [Clostridia bacterium]|nr:chromate transporter [Clostridia bacterium]